MYLNLFPIFQIRSVLDINTTQIINVCYMALGFLTLLSWNKLFILPYYIGIWFIVKTFLLWLLNFNKTKVIYYLKLLPKWKYMFFVCSGHGKHCLFTSNIFPLETRDNGEKKIFLCNAENAKKVKVIIAWAVDSRVHIYLIK